MHPGDLVIARPEGLFCPPGNFYIDPWRPVDRAVITHGHSDHARPGNGHYLTATTGAPILQKRLGADITLQTLAYGQTITHHGVTLSLYPAGHVLGSAQVRLEYQGEVWVASGDYKLEDDGTCAPFEPVRCHTFITESTFGLPIYRWIPQPELFADINAWWQNNAANQRTSVIFCYALGKAQRLLSGLDPAIGPIIAHGAMAPLNQIYRDAGVHLPATHASSELSDSSPIGRSMVLAPPSAQGTPWMKRYGDYADGFASGWMHLRGTRRRRGVDRGFVMSDHADWPGLQQAITATSAQRVFVTHGQVEVMVRWLTEQGLQAQGFVTEYGNEEAENESGKHSDKSSDKDSDKGSDNDSDKNGNTDSGTDSLTAAPATANTPEANAA